MNNESIDKWFEKETSQSGVPSKQAQATPAYQKWFAFALVLGIPLTIAGCSNQQLTAQDDCQYEKANGQPEIKCTEEAGSSSSWYRSRGYSSMSDPIKTTSPNYNSLRTAKGIGSGGKSSGGLFNGS